MKGNIRISKNKLGRHEFLISVSRPVVITSFFSYATEQSAKRAAIREAKRLGIDAS